MLQKDQQNWQDFSQTGRTRENLQNPKLKTERKHITITFTKVKMITKEDYEKLYAKKSDNLVEMDKFLERYKVDSRRNKKSKKTYDK